MSRSLRRMGKVAAVISSLAVVSLSFSLARGQTFDDLEALVDQLEADVQGELEMLGFIRAIIASASEFTPNCKAVPEGEWPDPTADLVWKRDSFEALQGKIALCERDYQDLYNYISGRVPNDGQLLDRIIGIMEVELAKNKADLVDDLANDNRGVSYSCAVMLSLTEMCSEASASRTE